MLQGMSWAQNQGTEEVIRPLSSQTHPFRSRVPSEHLCHLFWGLGCRLMEPSNENTFAP